jgi:hypothetical protein
MITKRAASAIRIATAFTLVLAAGWTPALAQNPDDLMPAESAAKAKVILQQAIDALGGPAYLNVRNYSCVGRYAAFEHSGALGTFIELRTYRELPDKERVEYDKDAKIVDVYSSQGAWTMDRGGVSDLPADAGKDFQEQLKTDINMILRYRLSEDGIVLRYGGTDIVDLKEADWVEISDHEGRTVRVAIDKRTHLPIRTDVTTRDPKTNEKTETGRFYSNYHPIAGIQTPFQISSFRNNNQTTQTFSESCQYNTDLAPDLFTRAGLDARWTELRKKMKK